MPFYAVAEIEINKPVTSVIQFVFEPTNDPFWVTGVIETHMLSVRPIGKGTQVQRIEKFMGRTIEYLFEMIAFDPEGHMKLLSMNTPVTFNIEYELKKITENKTLFRQTVTVTPKGAFRIIIFLITRVMRNNLNNDMQHLKEILEK